MAFFTKEWYEKMQDAHILALPESDEEWADFIRSFEGKERMYMHI